MIGGISSRWKQVIGYHYTGVGTTGADVHATVLDIINQCEEMGLRIHSVTSDMGSMNIQMWNAFKIMHPAYLDKLSTPATRLEICFFLLMYPISLRIWQKAS